MDYGSRMTYSPGLCISSIKNMRTKQNIILEIGVQRYKWKLGGKNGNKI